MNANVLHRWLKEHERSACHQLVVSSSAGEPQAPSPAQLHRFEVATAMQEPQPATSR